MSVFRNNNEEENDVITRSLRSYGDGGSPDDRGYHAQKKKDDKKKKTGGDKDKPKPGGDKGKGPLAGLKGDALKKAQALMKKMQNPNLSPDQRNQIAGQLDKLGANGKLAQDNNPDRFKPMDKQPFQKNMAGIVLDTARDADYYKDDMLQDGLYDESKLTSQYYKDAAHMGQYGNKTVDKAVDMTKDVYKGYDQAKDYDKTGYRDVENKYNAAQGYDKTDFGGIKDIYSDARDYDKTSYSDLDQGYGDAGQYQTADFTTGSRKADDIKQYMSPYEELVASRAKERMKKNFEEQNASRDAKAARQGAFGGSGAAIEQARAEADYLDRAKDYDAQSLQAAFESGAGLQDKELSDIYREQAGEEASKQFGKQTQLAGLQGQMAARDAAARETAAAKQSEFAGIEGMMGATNAEAQETARAKEAELAGIQGLLSARQSGATETARAKEAELAGLQGQAGASQLLGAQGAQQKEMHLTDLAALQAAGAQKDQRSEDEQQFPLDTLQKTQNIYATGIGGQPLAEQKQQPSTMQNIMSGITAGAGLLSTGASIGQSLGFFREGGIVALHKALYGDKYNG